jgi:hypothetical protein
MTASSLDNRISVLDLVSGTAQTVQPLACRHCGSTLASVRRNRQILEARIGRPSDCVCCDCETGNACPHCRSENLDDGFYDYGCDTETGYADSGPRFRCRDCGATGDVDDADPVLVMLPQPTPKPVASACLPSGLPEVA